MTLEHTNTNYKCLKCNHTWSYEDDACPECGGDFEDVGGIMTQSKKSAEEDYIKTPISVLKYIGELEAKFSSDSIEQIVLEVLEKCKAKTTKYKDVEWIIFEEHFYLVAKQVAERAERLTNDT